MLSVSLFLFLYSCGGGASSNSPKTVTETFYDKWEAGDYDAIISMYEGATDLSESEIEQTKGFLEQASKYLFEQSGGIKSFEVTEENINEAGDKATVKTKIVFENGESQEGEQELVKIDGKWKMKKQF